MISTITALTNAPPSSYSAPSRSEKVSNSGESHPFDKAIDKAARKGERADRKAEATEKLPEDQGSRGSQDSVQALYIIANASTPAQPQAEEPAAQAGDNTAVDSAGAMPAAAAMVGAEAQAAAMTVPTEATTPVPTETVDPQNGIAQEVSTETGELPQTPTEGETPPIQPPVTEEPVPVDDQAPVDEPATPPVDSGTEPAEPGDSTTPGDSTQPGEETAGPEDTTPVRITFRQHGTGMKDSYSLEGSLEGQTGTGTETGTLAGPPYGAAHGVRTDGVHGNSPIQFSELDRLAGARHTEVLQQVGQQIEGMVKSPRATLHIQLQPEELGRIDLRLTTNAHGLRVTMIADQPVTREILESNLGGLREALAQAGVNLNSLNVSQDGQPNQGYHAWQQPTHPGRPYVPETPDEEGQPAPVEMRTSAIDYRV